MYVNITNKHKNGFTIVELLIVIVVIAILAAITVVAYNGIRDRANRSVVEADLATLTKTIESWKITHGDVYPTLAQLPDVDIRVSKRSYLTVTTRNNFYYCASADQTQYSFGVVASDNQGYFLTNGKVTKQAGGSTFQADTCQNVGHADGAPGTSGYLATTGWVSWVKG